MKPRVTLNLSADGGFELWLNQEGRDLLVRELSNLSAHNDHFHLMPSGSGAGDVELSQIAYNDTDKVISSGKVLFRTDQWDETYFPHVMTEKS